MPNPWLNEHKSTAAMNYFFIWLQLKKYRILGNFCGFLLGGMCLILVCVILALSLILTPSETDNVPISLITHLLGKKSYCTSKTLIKKDQGKTT